MQNRIAKAKAYIKDHAPEIITAASAVTLTALAVIVINNNNKNLKLMQLTIRELKRQGRDFTFYPGVGIYLNETVE